VAQNRELRIARALKSTLRLAAEVMKARSTSFETCGVDSAFRTIVDQAALTGAGEYSAEQLGESPFFSRRFSAFSSVVQ